jgi:hypothetical protein
MGEEYVIPAERLVDYRAIDPGVAMGHMPVAQCLGLQAAATYEELGPGGQYDLAWVDLETSVAMAVPGAINPETGRHFTPKQRLAARNQAKTQFRTVAQGEQTLPELRARAMVAGASVDMQHTMSSGITLVKVGYKNQTAHFRPEHIPFLARIQTAAKLLLSETDRTPNDEALLRSMASMAIMTECLSQSGWILPAPPRQPWDINAVLRGTNKWSHIVIGKEAPAGTDTLNLPVEALGDELWGGSGAPHTTLQRYLELSAGFYLKAGHMAEKKIFDKIADRHIMYLHGHTPNIPSAPPRFDGETIGSANAESGAPPPKHPETAWYKAQSARDFRAINPMTLRVQVLNLEEAHFREPLDHFERHTLGWMQMDHAHAITLQAKEKRADAERVRAQAGRVSQFDARAHIATATAASEAADKLISEAKECYDTAIDTLKATADAIMTTRPGEAYDVLLDAEAGYVYKALFTEADADALEEVINTYVRRIGAFYTPMRTIENNLKASRNPHDLDQLDALQAAGLKAALCLLVGDSSDEAARDLALPASLRSGGMQARMDVVVFPKHYDGETDTMSYNAETPIHIQLVPGQQVTHERLYVALGRDLLMPQKDPLGRLAKLVATTSIRKFGPKRPSGTGPSSGVHKKQGKKGKRGPKKPQTRREFIDELGFKISNAIADAQDY